MLYKCLVTVQNFLWQGPILFLMLFAGIYLSFKLRFIQFREFFTSIKLVFSGDDSHENSSGTISPFQSLMTALAGSIGTGNITGIATAVLVGGYGSLFWMWVMAALGMATAYAESNLSIKFRELNDRGEMSGGPMYTLKNGLGSKHLAFIYAALAAVSSIGIGCLAQANSIVDAINAHFGINQQITGLVLAILTGATVIGGVKTIGKVASVVVPFMAGAYILSGLYIILSHWQSIPSVFYTILYSAFNGRAAMGGLAGIGLLAAMQNGVQYGIFANEAGLGSLAIAASSSSSSGHSHGLRSSIGVFFATMVVCTVTGFVLAIMYPDLSVTNLRGSSLAISAFSSFDPRLSPVVVWGLAFFAFTTMLAWCYYGEKALEFIFGTKAAIFYRWAFIFMVIVGASVSLDLVWVIANISSALMAVPNLLGILILARSYKFVQN